MLPHRNGSWGWMFKPAWASQGSIIRISIRYMDPSMVSNTQKVRAMIVRSKLVV